MTASSKSSDPSSGNCHRLGSVPECEGRPTAPAGPRQQNPSELDSRWGSELRAQGSVTARLFF